MTEIETRTYIKELASKPAFWIKDAKGGYFDIESFGLALIEVFTKSVIKDYKASLVPVAWMSTDGNHMEWRRYSLLELGFKDDEIKPLYALGETK